MNKPSDIDPRNSRAIAELVPSLDGVGVRLRLAPGLKAEATAYARSIGLSFNALCAVALRDYLNARQVQGAAPSTSKPVHSTVPRTTPSATATPAASVPMRKLGPNEKCYCGSGKKYKKCHGAPGQASN